MFDKVIKSARRRPLFELAESTQEVTLGRDAIERLLPHRDPLLLVDRISAVDLQQQTLRAHRRIDPADPVFVGHFPNAPVYPGALLVEAMGQASICAHQLIELGRAEVRADDKPQALRLLRVHHALFMAEALPGDELTLLSRRLEADSYTVVCAAQVVKNVATKNLAEQQIICAMAIMEVYLADETASESYER